MKRSLYPRCIFEIFERRIERHWWKSLITTKQKEYKGLWNVSRKVKWQEGLSCLTGVDAKEFISQLDRSADLLLESVPDLAVGVYSKLSKGVHGAYNESRSKILLDPNLLSNGEIQFLTAVFRALPLPDYSFEVKVPLPEDFVGAMEPQQPNPESGEMG